MLQLLRRYQKVIFIVVAITVILTFSFFGTYSAVAPGPQREKDREIGKGLDGRAVYAREIGNLKRFLSTDVLDSPVVEGKSYVNLFNDGVVKKDIFETGIGLMLLEHYYPVFEKELNEKMKKSSTFHPYAHPQVPFVSLESVWRQFTPDLLEHYKTFQARPMGEEGKGDREKLEALIALYLDQCSFPPSAARRFLMYLQQQYRHMVPQDPYLQSGDLAVFHAKTVEEWFGAEFVDVVAHFIHNTALYASSRGYKVSKEEAKASLMKIGMESAKAMQDGQAMVQGEFVQYYARALQMLQMDEAAAVEVWQKVLLMRRLFNDVGHHVFLDRTLYEQFHQFASQEVQVDLYAMQPALELRSENDLQKFELYLQAVAKDKGDVLGVPRTFMSGSEVMKKHPELVQKRFLIKVSSVKRSEVETGIGLRYMMNWQLDHFEKFPELADKQEREARYEALEAMAEERRAEADRYAMRMILEEHPDFIRGALATKNERVKEIALPYAGDYSPLEGIADSAKFLKRLEGGEALEFYSQDGEVFYNIAVIEMSEAPEVMTFQEADERGILKRLVKKEAEDALAPQLEAERKALAKKGIAFSATPEELGNFCAKYRFYNYLAEEKRRLQEGGEYMAPVPVLPDAKTLAKRVSLGDQFRLMKRNEEYVRKEGSELFSSDILKMGEGEWSAIFVRDKEGSFFFQVREKAVDKQAIEKGMQEGKQMLSNEAKRYLMSKLLTEMDAKRVVRSL